MVERIRGLVKNKRVLFVGNSVESIQYGLGKFIDKYDIVVRFGRAIEFVAEKHKDTMFAKRLGRKVNIWVTGQFRSHTYNKLKQEFTNGRFKDVEILLNECRGNFHLKDYIIENHIPKDMPFTKMFNKDEIINIMGNFGLDISFKEKNLAKRELRPSAGFITILWFIYIVKTYKSLDLIGFDFFHKSTDRRAVDKRGLQSQCDPHSWHMPIYTTKNSAHNSQLEKEYVSMLERHGKLKWHVLSDLDQETVKYTGWMKGQPVIYSSQKPGWRYKKRVKKLIKQGKVSKDTDLL
jgi:hypothetical protein